MRIVQINTSANIGSTGRIMEDLGQLLIMKGHDSYCVYGRDSNGSQSNLIRVGNRIDQLLHVAQSRIADRHGFGSVHATKTMLDKIREINPDIIHLHNIHGYYLNVKVLFDFLKERNVPVVWTFHDCWAFTGHCSYFDAINCFKWQSECHNCPNLKGYPASWLVDNSKNNFNRKKEIFTGHRKLVLVSPSEWLASHVKNSFLHHYTTLVINNGIDLERFNPDKSLPQQILNRKYKKTILGAANIWDKRKGFDDFIKLRSLLSQDVGILLVGLTSDQIRGLPDGILGISRIAGIDEMAQLYSAADIFVNPTYVDNFPTVNLEALACGTPVVTYDTGGSPETIDASTGAVVTKGDIYGLAERINRILHRDDEGIAYRCRSRAVSLYNKNEKYMEYYNLYNQVLSE